MKLLSLIALFILILSLIPIKDIVINAITSTNPQFSIKQISANPDPSVQGDDITISGVLESSIKDITSINKEVVIVLDISNNANEGGFKKIETKLKNFIGKLKNNTLNENLKIGIVTYSNDAEIANINKKMLVDIATEKDNDSGDIKKYLGRINTNGESINRNIGEALRQAVYLLDTSGESNHYADKTIILIGEGNPNAITVDNNGKMYLDTTKYNEDSNNRRIITDSSANSLQYAKEVGNIIKNKGYNAYTIGIDIDSKDAEQGKKEIDTLKEIHSTMTGFTLNEANYVEKGLYLETTNPSNNRKTIEGIFNDVSDCITKNYSINNANMSLNLTTEFTPKNQVNSIKLNSIEYKKDVSNGTNNKIYKAEIPFSFVINAKKSGEDQKILNNLTINYPWNGTSGQAVLNTDLNVTVNTNEAPDILANLKSKSTIDNAEKGNTIKLEYEISPQEFTTNNVDFNKKEIGEAIFLVGLSSKTGGQIASYLQRSIANVILNENDSKLKAIKYGVIGYNDTNYYVGDNVDKQKSPSLKTNPNIENLILPLYDLTVTEGQNRDEFREYFFQANIGGDTKSIFNYRLNNDLNKVNIDNSLESVIKIFDKFGDSKNGKAIILVNYDDVIYSKQIAEKINNKGYKIITLDISNNLNLNINKLHKDLGGIYSSETLKSDYIIANLRDSQNYNDSDADMKEVADRLKAGVINNNTKITPEFEFNLNNNFEYVQGSESGIKAVTTDGGKLKFYLNNPMEYSYSGEMSNGKYIFKAKPQTISFEVKIKDATSSKLEFGNSYMKYRKFDLTTETKKLTTPIVSLKEEVKNITHGLYNGISGKEIKVYEKNKTEKGEQLFEIAKNSTVTFGSRFTLSGSSTTFELNVDNNFNTLNTNDIKIYRILSDASGNNSLTEITSKTIESNLNNKFKISINNLNDNTQIDKDILVVYQGRLKESIESSQVLINEIKFSDTLKRSIQIITPEATNNSPSLPDLF